MRARRSFSDDFKKQIVKSVALSPTTQTEIARQYKISPVLITKWKNFTQE